MSKILPDFVSDESSSAPAVIETPEPVVEAAAPVAEPTPEAAPAAEGQPRGPDGKFAPVAPVVEAAPAPIEPVPVAEAPAPVAPAPVHQPEQAFAPVAALLDEREKRQAAERRANELQQWRDQQEAQARRQPAPDPDQDPAAFRAHQAQQLDQVFWDQRLEMSRGFAEMRHGPEKTTQAFQWGVERCDFDPFFNAKVRASKDPVGFVVGEYQREQLVSTMTPERIAAFQAWEAAQAAPAVAAALAPALAATPPIAAPAAPPPAPVAPRASLAAAPSAARSAAPIPRDGEATFDAMFSR